MGVEQASKSKPEHTKTGKVIVQVGPLNLGFQEDSFVRTMGALETKIYEATKVDFDTGVKTEIQDAVRNGGYLIVYATHESHYDGRPLGKATKQILEIANDVLPENKRYQGFVLPKATSIDTGDQDPTMKKYSEDVFLQGMAEDKLFTVDFTREKDQREYNLPDNTVRFMRNMIRHIRSHHGIAILPEATVEGGRNANRGNPLKPWISIHGIQQFDQNTMYTIARLTLSEKLNPVFVPVGIFGTFRVYSPDKYKPPTTTIVRAVVPGLPRDLVKVRVGSPIALSDITNDLNSNNIPVSEASINDSLARRLAPLVPKRARGVYA